MTEIWALAALWLGLALLPRCSRSGSGSQCALGDLVGTVAQLVLGAAFGGVPGSGSDLDQVLAVPAPLCSPSPGAELDPEVFRRKWKEKRPL